MVSSRVQSSLSSAHGTVTRRGSVPWSLITWVWVLGWLFVGSVAAVVVGGPARLLGDRRGRVAHACVAFAFRTIVRYHPRYRITLGGLENLPPGAAVLCPNHQSLSDVVYLFSLPVDYRWVVKKELFLVPFFGAAMRVIGYPAIDRGNPDSAVRMMDKVNAILDDGLPVLTFPEGTRSLDGSLGRFFNGPARIAVGRQVPLIPIGIVGTEALMPRGSASYPAQAHVSIHVGPPIATTGCGVRDVRALTRELRVRVETAKQVAQGAIDRANSVG
jgi:1-acyl-sn-glycerol-3-phosphate acyltransferase